MVEATVHSTVGEPTSMSKVSSLISSLALLVLIVVPLAIWKWRKRRRKTPIIATSNNVASAIAKFETTTNVETKQKEGDEETGLLIPRRSSNVVASNIAKFETTTTNSTKPNNDPPPPSSSRSIWKSFVFGCGKRSSSTNTNKRGVISSTSTSPSSASSCYDDCLVCQQRIFPTQPKTTARQNNTFHTSCFKCSECGTKLFNFPEESHAKIGPTVVLHCRRCHLDSQQKYKSSPLPSKLAGTKTLVGDSEQGDILQVKEAIGDDLEDAMVGMIPRCAMCGGNFLTTINNNEKGGHDDISVVGALKYHKECLSMGRPRVLLQQQPDITLVPVQAARYLPETIILRISSSSTAAAGKKKKVMASLYFCWNGKQQELKSLRREKKPLDNSLRVQFHLDQKAGSLKTQRTLPTPGDDDELCVDVIGDEMAAAPTTIMGLVHVRAAVEPPDNSMIASSSLLRAKLAFTKFQLNHSLLLEIPCCPNQQQEELVVELTRATLTVEIQGMDPV